MKIRLIAIVASMIVGVAGACAAPDKPSAPKPTVAKKSEEPAVKVLYTFFTDETVQFVAEISNPADRTRVGVETSWKAYDSDGIIVASFTGKRPPIPPRGSIFYAGHAGEVSGVAESVKVNLSKKGALTAKAPRPAVKVGEATFERADYDFTDGAHTYDVSTVLTAMSDVAGKDVNVQAILRDESGEIVGAGWAGGPTLIPEFGQDLPDKLAKGDKVRLKFDAHVAEGTTPAKVEVTASS